VVPPVHPVAEGALARLPKTLSPLSYAKYLTIAKTTRPVLRNYSVRAYRPDGPDGPELDVDLVLHGSAGPAAVWADSCAPGQTVLAAAQDLPTPAKPVHAWVVGEAGLAGGSVPALDAGRDPKGDIMFCGYWRAGRGH
jgi:NADPH-dependent ferric siderophore reductase